MTERFDGNFCRYFRLIEENPTAIAPQMTVREFMGAKEHVRVCDVCSNRVDRVLASAPPDEDGPSVNLN